MEARGSLTDRVVLVTGVSRRAGIGFAIMERLLGQGASVLATGLAAHDREMPWGADDEGGARAISALDGADRRARHLEVDLADSAVPAMLVAEAISFFGRIDGVVANHARSAHDDLATVGVDELDRCWAVNARSVVLLAKAMLERRPPGPGGRLVLFTSGQHQAPMAGEIAYAASKGAVHQLTASLADALADRGVTVNCINPGPVDTGYASGAFHERIARVFPASRWGQPADIAKIVGWLVSDESQWITGQVLDCDGGFGLRRSRV